MSGNKFATWLDRSFGVSHAGSNVGQELRAGLTTFATMAYILIVNPAILSTVIRVENATQQLLTATALATAIGCFLMATLARYPFAVAPGMGINAYFAYTVVGGRGIPWETALGAVFISGVIFLGMSLVGLRHRLVAAIPSHLRAATAAGIGLFLALIGLEQAGVIIDDPQTLLTLGDVSSAPAILTILGVIATSIMLYRRVRLAILFGILGVTAVAIVWQLPVYEGNTVFPGRVGLLGESLLASEDRRNTLHLRGPRLE
jgi:AGZA family xanthine/uracil permease-like MFS transporter